MDTPSRYKRTKTCSDKNRKTIVETVPLLQQSIFRKYHHWRWDVGSLLRAQAEDTEQNMGNQRRQMTLHSETTMSIKKVMYVIFFTNQGPAIQIAAPKGKSVNARFYKGNILQKSKKYVLSCRPATGLRGFVVALLFYVHGKHLRSCRDGQLT